MPASGQTWLNVLVLLLLFLDSQDLFRGLASVGGSVGISDANVKDSRSSTFPESVGRYIAAEFWWGLCTWSVSPVIAVPTCVDEGFVGDGGWG